MAYGCTTCGKSKRLPDFCCGKPMLQQGTFYCETCGSTYSQSGDCCEQPLNQV
ncbi:hypothetical protein MFMK1_000948 [Metallumcola ferriviriculae]|uniref:Uncharacterized protein n=1 Tax=Metallumcola ferriviriculae TaxID=3039180 RepID=A0AAU0UL83_9FIRM|nr:hypothetical protein MFMK1_000948 [Desulfitibacteraceae bacterium MK1]